MSLVRLHVEKILYGYTQNNSYILVLNDVDGNQQVPLVMTGLEAYNITSVMKEQTYKQHLLIYDLFKDFSYAFGISLKKVVIYKFAEGIFYSKMILEKDNDIQETIIEAKTSDAITLAVCFEAPVFIEKEIIDEIGSNIPLGDDEDEDFGDIVEIMDDDIKLTPDSEEEEDYQFSEEDYLFQASILNDLDDDFEESLIEDEMRIENFKMNELEELLKDAIENEAYEYAAQIRDEIARRKNL